MSRISDPQLADQWRHRLNRFQDSDLTVAQFCQNEGYSVASFYRWRHKLTEGSASALGTFVAVKVDPSPNEGGNATINIELPGGAIVRLAPATPQEVLRKSVAAIIDATSIATSREVRS